MSGRDFAGAVASRLWNRLADVVALIKQAEAWGGDWENYIGSLDKQRALLIASLAPKIPKCCSSGRHFCCISTDPKLARKAADIAELYLHPPEDAVVWSVEGKPHIEALERTQG